MKYIGENDPQQHVEETSNGYIINTDGFDQLIEANNNGEYAVWEYGGFVTTTDDIPENCDQLEYSEIIRQMKVKSIERQSRLERAKNKNAERKL